MLTFRKAVIIAAFILTFLYLFSSSHSSSSRQEGPEPGGDADAAKVVRPAVTKAASPPTVRLRPTNGVAPPNSADAPPQPNTPSTSPAQKPLHAAGRSLLDRLQYQYPYEPSGKFPGYIWQTWRVAPGSGTFDEKLRTPEASWTEKHPGMVHEVVTDELEPQLIDYLYASVPEVVAAYHALPVPVLRADFFRYLILLARGGVYSDIDTKALKSAADWLPASVPPSSVGLVVGIEADPDRPDWADWYSRRVQFCQWTLQAKPGHPALRSIVAQITEDTLRMRDAGLLRTGGRMDKSIVEFTGPARWTDTVFAYFNNPRYFRVDPTGPARNISWEDFTGITAPKRVGDVVVLPITSFSPGVGQMGAQDTNDPMAFVEHSFEGKALLPSSLLALQRTPD